MGGVGLIDFVSAECARWFIALFCTVHRCSVFCFKIMGSKKKSLDLKRDVSFPGGYDRFFSEYPEFCMKTKSLPSLSSQSSVDSSCSSCGTPHHDQVRRHAGDGQAPNLAHLFSWNALNNNVNTLRGAPHAGGVGTVHDWRVGCLLRFLSINGDKMILDSFLGSQRNWKFLSLNTLQPRS